MEDNILSVEMLLLPMLLGYFMEIRPNLGEKKMLYYIKMYIFYLIFVNIVVIVVCHLRGIHSLDFNNMTISFRVKYSFAGLVAGVGIWGQKKFGYKICHNIYNCLIARVAVFVTFGIIIFINVQQLFIPKWNYPVFVDGSSDSLNKFLAQNKREDDVIFVGTSFTTFAVSPMLMYKQNGIVSYNLGSSVQSIDITYFLLEEAFKTQSPKLVVLDVSSLFFVSKIEDSRYRYILDNIPLSINKINFAIDYASYIDGMDDNEINKRFIGALFPIYQYHSRWNDLTKSDFPQNNDNYTIGGHRIDTRIEKSGISIEDMNNTALKMYEDRDVWKKEIVDNEVNELSSESILYMPIINDTNSEYLNDIRELCRENGANILLVKYPCIKLPNEFSSSWTSIRSDYMHAYANENGYEFLDLLYDIDVGIDITSDFVDGGTHLNYLGARKVSSFLANYLSDEYEIQPKENKVYNEKISEYDKLTVIADLQTEQNLTEYLKKLSNNIENYIICFSTNDYFNASLSDEEIEMLGVLGMKSDFNADRDNNNIAYISLIDSGDVKYEAISNRRITYSYPDANINITSSGWLSTAYSSIVYNGSEYSSNTRGINIVVIDKTSGLVIDSVSFDTYIEEHKGVHKGVLSKFEAYREYLR